MRIAIYILLGVIAFFVALAIVIATLTPSSVGRDFIRNSSGEPCDVEVIKAYNEAAALSVPSNSTNLVQFVDPECFNLEEFEGNEGEWRLAWFGELRVKGVRTQEDWRLAPVTGSYRQVSSLQKQGGWCHKAVNYDLDLVIQPVPTNTGRQGFYFDLWDCDN